MNKTNLTSSHHMSSSSMSSSPGRGGGCSGWGEKKRGVWRGEGMRDGRGDAARLLLLLPRRVVVAARVCVVCGRGRLRVETGGGGERVATHALPTTAAVPTTFAAASRAPRAHTLSSSMRLGSSSRAALGQDCAHTHRSRAEHRTHRSGPHQLCQRHASA